MPRSVHVHSDHQPTVVLALERNGFLTQGDLAAYLEIALSTVSNFFRGINVSISKFEAICDALGLDPKVLILPKEAHSSADTAVTPSAIAFFAYDTTWVGRESLIQKLNEQLQRSCRLLLLTGLSGIGKTALAERLLVEQEQQGRNITILRENFDNQEQLTFSHVATRLLEKCGQPVMTNDRQNEVALMNRLIHCLQAYPYWLVLDSLEEVLEGDEQTGWSTFKDNGFVQFFQKVLAAETFQSRLILTSQELPAQIAEAGTRYQNFWYNQPLGGLAEAEQLDLFEKTGLEVQSASGNRAYFMRIGRAYEGHPLALRIIAGEIGSHPFYGQVQAYWNKYGQEIETVEQAIAAAQTGQISGADDQWQLDRFTRLLRRNVRSRLEQTFSRLRVEMSNAYLLLCETSVYRCAVPEDWWLSHLDYWNCQDQSKQAALEALKERYLVEESVDNEHYLLRQHNLIRSISLEHLKNLEV